MSQPRPLTMADIAARAGVAQSTVSYVLSGQRPIAARTRQRVLDAIEELGYRPHAGARALASGATRALALLLPAPHHELRPMQHIFIAGAALATSEADYSLVLLATPTRPSDVTTLAAERRTDGIILMEVALRDSRVRRLQLDGHPFSLIGHCADTDGTSFVDLDFDYVVKAAVQHLAELGHRRIVLLNESLPQRRDYGPAVRSREAFAEILATLGLEGTEVDAGSERPEVYATARRALKELRPTAVVTFALASTTILAAARDEGLRVPEDISVVGILAPQLAEILTPSLTTIDVPAFEMGRMGAEMLIRRLAGEEDPPTQTLLRPPLTIRESTAPARAR